MLRKQDVLVFRKFGDKVRLVEGGDAPQAVKHRLAEFDVSDSRLVIARVIRAERSFFGSAQEYRSGSSEMAAAYSHMSVVPILSPGGSKYCVGAVARCNHRLRIEAPV